MIPPMKIRPSPVVPLDLLTRDASKRYKVWEVRTSQRQNFRPSIFSACFTHKLLKTCSCPFSLLMYCSDIYTCTDKPDVYVSSNIILSTFITPEFHRKIGYPAVHVNR